MLLMFLSAYWGSFGEDAGDAPQLRGARSFSLDELKKCTNDFSRTNEIGSGGYGKVQTLMVIYIFNIRIV